MKASRNYKKLIKEHMVHYDFITKKAYVIEEEDLKSLRLYKNRFFLIAIAVLLVANFLLKPLPSVIIGVLALIYLEYGYRAKFLKSLKEAKNYTPSSRKASLDELKKEDSSKLLIKGILYLVLGILIILNSLEQQVSTLLWVISILICLFAVYSSVNCFMALIKKKA